MNFIVVDIYEQDHIERLLSTFMAVERQNLVQQNLLDYFWFAGDGHSITIERKGIMDFLASMPRLERQLRIATNHADEVGLIIEGIVVPLAGGEVGIYQVGKSPKYLYQMKISGVQYSSIMGYIWQLKRVANITTYFTSTIEATAWALKTFVENSQKLDSTLLQHYTRTKRIGWQSNPAIETLMGIKDKDGFIVGEKKAMELVTKVGGLWTIVNSTPKEVAQKCHGIGTNTVQRLINAIKEK